MKVNPDVFDDVLRAMDRLEREILSLEDDLAAARRHEEDGLAYARFEVDLAFTCARVEAASDKLVEAIRDWMPMLAPPRRALDEVLATLDEWYPDRPRSERLANDARQLFAELRAHSYGRTLNLARFPRLDDFPADLRAILDRVRAQ